ncbi:hydroxysteroid dehydrogenase [Trifolium repens]|nr:hydroxysteroid dehydrogenase [Trifolium repens]
MLAFFLLRVDHLVNNAGIVPLSLFEDTTDITIFAPTMDINFWGSAYGTYFSIPHLRKSKGKIIAIASSAGWLPAPRMMFYNASKAAVISLYETLRTELGKDIGITIVTPGLIESEMTQGKFLSKEGQMVLDQEMRDVQVSVVPIRSVTEAAKGIVNSACRGDSYLTEPAWIRTTFYWKVFCPEVLEFLNRWLLLSGSSERETISKKLINLPGLNKYVYPESVRNPKIKPN